MVSERKGPVLTIDWAKNPMSPAVASHLGFRGKPQRPVAYRPVAYRRTWGSWGIPASTQEILDKLKGIRYE